MNLTTPMNTAKPEHNQPVRTLPDGWREVRLGDVVKSNCQNIGKNYEYSQILYLDTGSITEGKIQSLQNYQASQAPSRAKRLVRDENIVYSNVRPIQRHYGFIKKPPENLVVSTGFSVIETNQSKAEPRFIYHLLTSNNIVEKLDAIAEGATSAYPALKPSDIEGLKISLPPVPEQKAIAEILSSLDDKIDLLHRQNKTLEDMAQTLFRQWFIEQANAEWEEGELGDLVEVKYGKDHKKLLDGNIPVYGSGGIMRFADTILYDSESVLVPRKGTLNNVIYINQPFWTIDTMFYTIMNKPNLAKFIYHFLNRKDLAAMNVGSAVPSMTTNILNSIPLLLPPEEVLEKFELSVTPFYLKVDSNRKQISTLENLRDTLLPKLMSGEIRVKH